MDDQITAKTTSVRDFLKMGLKGLFIIPEYQRPYAWTKDQAEQLFTDIWDFSLSIEDFDSYEPYFLGSIIACKNENSLEIIDGQQRTTTLILLLRAIYAKLSLSENLEDKKVKTAINDIENTLWKKDRYTSDIDKKYCLVESRVINFKGNETLKNILEKGVNEKETDDNYSNNFLHFKDLLNDKCSNSPIHIYRFIQVLLDKCVVLPVIANSQKTALTIFSTLNDRGLPLSDADIFKAKIYGILPNEKKNVFINQWGDLEKNAANANENVQRLFYYYMFYLRAKDKDCSSTTPGLRGYYLDKTNNRLTKNFSISDLNTILNLWNIINVHESSDEEAWMNDSEILRALNILAAYPNEFWKYPVVIYYLCHRNNKEFVSLFKNFLRKLIVELLSRYLLYPTINTVKTSILKLNAQIISSTCPDFDFKPFDEKNLGKAIKNPNLGVVRMLLLTYAYEHQESLLPENWQIEHILPKKWNDILGSDIPVETLNELIEHIGNKTAFERRLNIKASNNYLKRKQEQYSESNIVITKSLKLCNDSNWTIEHIKKRDEEIEKTILKVFSDWSLKYDSQKNVKEKNSLEEKGAIAKAREMAKSMLDDGLPIAKIATYSGLSEEDIKAL